MPGTHGSILDTARHLVGTDASYLVRITGNQAHAIDEDHMTIAELRSAMEGHEAKCSAILASDLDPEAVLEVHNEDGSVVFRATTGVRVAQVIHHGTDHRSHAC